MASPSAHALLSASSAHRWLKCTAAPRFETQFPKSTSVYAEEGTLAHSICELYARRKFIGMTTRAFNKELKKLQTNELYSEEMLHTAESYVSYLVLRAGRFPADPHVSFEVKVDLGDVIPDGFGTCDCIMVCGDTLHITDYKHGQGVPVNAENNAQMMLYAHGALRRYALIYGDAIKNITMAIVQPRISEEPSEWGLTADELEQWCREYVKPKADAAYNGQGEFVPGSHCKFCRGKELCPARARQNTALEDFKDCVLPDKLQPSDPLDPDFRKILGLPPILTNVEVGSLITRGKYLLDWYESLKDYALREILAGRSIPGYKCVEGKSNRAFRDDESAMQALIDSGLDKDSLYEVKPKSLAKLEKQIGPKRFSEIVGDMVFKPAGKPTLAEESDPRPVFTSAAADFSGAGVNVPADS